MCCFPEHLKCSLAQAGTVGIAEPATWGSLGTSEELPGKKMGRGPGLKRMRKHESRVAPLRHLLVTGQETGSKLEEEIGTNKAFLKNMRVLHNFKN